tara:strand:+ start:409 stop:594 length:186 start_codon:yes stop_codon:yes gene_type:complete
MANYRKMMDTWKDWRLSDKTLKESKKLVNEGHVITFSKDEMAQLHKDGRIEKDGHTYIYNE